MSITIPLYSQYDPKWKDRSLGKSSLHMGDSGCYVTSFCMMISNFAINENPEIVVTKLSLANAFTDEGFLTYDGLMRAYPTVVFNERVNTTNAMTNVGSRTLIDVCIKKIQKLIRYGQPTILLVDNIGNDGIQDHAVCAYDYKTNNDESIDFKIHDPDGGRDIWFTDKYGSVEKKLYGYLSIIGSPIAFPDNGDSVLGGVVYKLAEAKRGVNVSQNVKEAFDVLTG